MSWARIVNTTIKKYLKGEQTSILRQRKLLGLLENRGRVKFGESGSAIEWKPKYRRNAISTYTDMAPVQFSRFNRHTTASLPWVQLIMAESVSKLETLVNKNAEQIIGVFSGLAKNMLEDIRDGFGSELYMDGVANPGHLYGIRTMVGKGATLGTGSNGFAGGVYQADDNYAGLSTKQGDQGGTWSGAWPSGDGGVEYDHWSPLIVKYTDTAFDPTGSSSTTWAANCVQAMHFAVSHGNRNKAKSGETDVFVMNTDMFAVLQSKYFDKERVILQDAGGATRLSVGFASEMLFDGVSVIQDFGVPTGEVYGFNLDSMELLSLQKQLFEPAGPEWNSSDQSWRFAIDFYGNLRFSQPRDFVRMTAD